MAARVEPPRFEHVRRELQRARGARRLLPWAVGSALTGYAFLSYAAGSLRGGLPLLAGGLLLAAFIGGMSIPRCPACGGNLWRRGERPGPPTAPRPTAVERERRCPHCNSAFAA